MYKGGEHLCVGLLLLFFTCITFSQSKALLIAVTTVSMAFVLPLLRHSLARLISVNQVIPRSILERASGFAIFTIIKAGFLFSARGGGGVVIARLDNGCEPLFCQSFSADRRPFVSSMVRSECHRSRRCRCGWSGWCRNDRLPRRAQFPFGQLSSPRP